MAPSRKTTAKNKQSRRKKAAGTAAAPGVGKGSRARKKKAAKKCVPAKPAGRSKAANKTNPLKPYELIPMEATLLPPRHQESLIKWFELYMGIEAGAPGSNTFKAKRSDLQNFIRYLNDTGCAETPDQWTKAVTESFLRYLYKKRDLAASTVNRALATLKHAANWIEKQRPFLVGNPCEGVRTIEEDAPDWNGLEDDELEAILAAADKLVEEGEGQYALRDRAILVVLLRTGLRVSELLSLDLKNYKAGAFVGVRRKGKRMTKRLPVAEAAREHLDCYIKEQRGRGAGPLLQSKTGKRLAVQNVDDALKKIAAKAGSMGAGEIHLSAHMLRHTCLRKAAEVDIRYAMKLSGHTSSQYIWRYTEPGAGEFEKALEDLYR